MKRLPRYISFAVLCWIYSTPQGLGVEGSGGAADVRLVVTGIADATGQLRAALVDSKDAYKDESETPPVKTKSVQVAPGSTEVVFTDVPFGTYAVKVFHDKNDNGELDTNFLGIPTEKYGFSNNARSKFGLPAFEEVKFEIDAPIVKLEVKVENY